MIREQGVQGPEGLIGRELGGYRLERVIGIGATGGTYLGTLVGEEEGLPPQAAVKVLFLPWQLSTAEREEFRTRFTLEALILQRLHHPHIVSVLRSGEESGLLFTVLPYLAGGTLASVIASNSGGLPFPEVVTTLDAIADALDYAHSNGVVHRDVKPANILLDSAGNVFLSDFSIATLYDSARTKLTTTGRILGTPSYMAPEQLRGESITASVDIYSLGVVLFEMVTGQTPFEGTTLVELIRQQVDMPPPLPRRYRADLPEPAEAAILHALAKRSDSRFATAGALASAFSEGVMGRWAPGLTSVFTPATAVERSGRATTLGPARFPDTLYGPVRRRRFGGIGRSLLAILFSPLLLLAYIVTLPIRLLWNAARRLFRTQQDIESDFFIRSDLGFGIEQRVTKEPSRRREAQRLLNATLLFPRGLQDELDRQSDQEAEEAFRANVNAGRSPYAGVRIRTQEQLLRIAQDRGWALHAQHVADLQSTRYVTGNLDLAANFSEADLMHADLHGMNLHGASFSRANLKRIDLSNSYLSQVKFAGADLREANLSGAYLDKADLGAANLRGANLTGCTLFQVNLRGVDLRLVRMDATTMLLDCSIDPKIRVADVVWNGALLTQVKWSQAEEFGDELAADQERDRRARVARYRMAARGYRALSLALRAQGSHGYAAAYRLREQAMERRALLAEFRIPAWLFSHLLNAVAGYGERPERAFITYVLVVLGFAGGYYYVAGTLGESLPFIGAVVLSITSFHGRGFFPGSTEALTSPIVIMATVEALIGLFIELVFIAAFSRRFLAG